MTRPATSQGDPYQHEFTAKVTRRVQHEPAIVVDQTCFCPTSGGQQRDTGTLGSARVLDVVAQGEQILHIVDVMP